jgi:hypothetical protein
VAAERSREEVRAYGWRDFDQEVVEGLVENDDRFISRRPGGWIACPLNGHYDDRLAWKDDNYRKGSVAHGDPPASFRASPTYVLERPLDNIVAGRDLIAEAIDGRWGKAEARRLGNENSGDAVTWNVFRSLQEAGRLADAARLLAGVEASSRPELFLWGRRIAMEESDVWAELQAVRDRLEPDLEPGKGQQTEPDACLHIAGWGWVLIEARLGSGTGVYDDPTRVESWLDRYSTACPGVFDEAAIRAVKPREFPEELLRTVAFAHSLRAEAEHAVVVALVRENDPTEVERWVGRCLAETATVEFRRATWEDLYRALDPDEPSLQLLRRYLESKSYGLRQAFAV